MSSIWNLSIHNFFQHSVCFSPFSVIFSGNLFIFSREWRHSYTTCNKMASINFDKKITINWHKIWWSKELQNNWYWVRTITVLLRIQNHVQFGALDIWEAAENWRQKEAVAESKLRSFEKKTWIFLRWSYNFYLFILYRKNFLLG